MENMTPLLKVSKDMGITPDKCRYWLSLLEAETEKIGKARFVKAENISHLHQMAQLVADGITPGEAAKRTKTSPVELPANPIPQPGGRLDLATIAARMEGMERAILAMAEKVSRLVDDNRTLRDDNQVLRQEISGLRLLLEPPKIPAPIRANLPPVQRELSLFESVKGLFDDMMGFVAGHG